MSEHTQMSATATTAAKASGVQAGLLQRKCACGNSAGLTGECSGCHGERLVAQPRLSGRRAPEDGTQRMPALVQEVLGSGGRSLDAETRAEMESRLGHDFSRVRVHTDERAGAAARSLGAAAFTAGSDIVFAPGAFSPQTPTGRRIMTHELVHVVQHGAGRAAAGAPLSSAHTDPAERQADGVAGRLESGLPAMLGAPAAPSSRLSLTPPTPGGTPPAAKGPTVTPAMKLRMVEELYKARLNAPPATSLRRESNRTFAVYAIVKPDGTVTYDTAFYTDEAKELGHAEEQVIRSVKGKLTRNDTLVVAVDQVPCPGKCNPLLREFREDPQHGSLRVYSQTALRADAPPGITPDNAGTEYHVSGKTAAKRPLGERFLREEGELRRVRLPIYNEPPPSVPAAPEGGVVEGAPPSARLLAAGEGGGEDVTGLRKLAPTGEDVVWEGPPGRVSKLGSGVAPDLGPRPKTVVLGVTLSFGAGIAVSLFRGAFHDKVQSDLEKLPKPAINKRAAKDFIDDPNTAASMKLVDILSSELSPIGPILKETHDQIMTAATIRIYGASIAGADAQGRLDRLSVIQDELDAYELQLFTAQDNLDTILEHEEDALKTADACDKLRKVLNSLFMEAHWAETGLSIEEHGAIDSNLAHMSVSIRMAFGAAHRLKKKIAALESEEQEFRKMLDALVDDEVKTVFEKELKRRLEAQAAAAKAAPPSAPAATPRKAVPVQSPLLPSPFAAPEQKEVNPAAAIQPWEDRPKQATTVADAFESEKSWLISTESKLRQLAHEDKRGSAEYKNLYQQFDAKRKVWPGQLKQSIATLEKENAAAYWQTINRLKAIDDWLKNEGQNLLEQVLAPG